MTKIIKAVGFILPTPNYGINCGTHNGYAAVPPGHPYYGLNYDDLNGKPINVHCGLTYSDKVGDLAYLPGFLMVKGELPDEFSNWWCFGFDTCHYGDNKTNWGSGRVIAETLNLIYQVDELVNLEK